MKHHYACVRWNLHYNFTNPLPYSCIYLDRLLHLFCILDRNKRTFLFVLFCFFCWDVQFWTRIHCLIMWQNGALFLTCWLLPELQNLSINLHIKRNKDLGFLDFFIVPCCSQGATLLLTLRCRWFVCLVVCQWQDPHCVELTTPTTPANSTQLNWEGCTKQGSPAGQPELQCVSPQAKIVEEVEIEKQLFVKLRHKSVTSTYTAYLAPNTPLRTPRLTYCIHKINTHSWAASQSSVATL